MKCSIKYPREYVEMTYNERDASDGAGTLKTLQIIGGCVFVGCAAGVLIHRGVRGHWIWQAPPARTQNRPVNMQNQDQYRQIDEDNMLQVQV